jgi:glutamyl-tRNA synthetase
LLQSERKALYRKHIQPLLASRKAYRCFCSGERIDDLNRSRQERGLPLGYDRRCTEISQDESSERAYKGHSHVIRFKAPDEYPRYDDFVYGRTGQGKDAGRKLHIDQPVYDDPVLMKSDGYPTYHFANVVDDHLMKITHVIRGSEWMSSTPLHAALYAALGWGNPSFGHVPLLVNSDGQKLSKRHLDLDVSSFRDRGIYPEALVNFAALLGWSHQRKSDLMPLRELQQVFDLKFTRGNTIVSFDKLGFLQQQHTRRYIEQGSGTFQKMVHEVSEAIGRQHDAPKIQILLRGRRLEDVVAIMLRAGKNDFQSPSQFAQRCSIYFEPLPSRLSFDKTGSFAVEKLATAAAALCFLPAESWTAEAHRQNILALQPDASASTPEPKVLRQTWKKDFYSFLRQALLGGAPGPAIHETMEILGKEICTERIRSAAMGVRAGEASKKPQVKVQYAPLPRDHIQPFDHERRPE